MINYGNLLDLELIEIGEDFVRPICYINPDATFPLQIVEYTSAYTVPLHEAVEMLNGHASWSEDLWADALSEEQHLIDSMSPSAALKYIGFTVNPIIELPNRGSELATMLQVLKPGEYLVRWIKNNG